MGRRGLGFRRPRCGSQSLTVRQRGRVLCGAISRGGCEQSSPSLVGQPEASAVWVPAITSSCYIESATRYNSPPDMAINCWEHVVDQPVAILLLAASQHLRRIHVTVAGVTVLAM